MAAVTQILGLVPGEAAVYVADDDIERRPLEGTFDWVVGAEQYCIGRVDDGQHVPCPRRRIVGQMWQCSQCLELEDPACVFEPRCRSDPSACHCSFGTVPHVVYVAFHGALPKVGMTQARREHARLWEQGADAYFIVESTASRAEAREAERRVSFLHGIPEWRTHKETLPALVRPVPWDRIEARADSLRQRLAPHHDVGPLLTRLEHPAPQPLPGRPHRATPEGEHRGTWLGRKGPHLFFQGRAALDVGSSPVMALPGPSLVGRMLHSR